MHASNICSTRGKNRNVCSLGWYPFVLWKWFEMVSLVDDLTAVEHRSKKCQPIMRCKWRETVESQTRRVGKWFKETVAPAEGGKEGLTVTAAILQMIWPEKSHHGMWDDNGFCRMWNMNLWNRTSIGEASFLCIHLGREVARGWFMATHNQTMATNLYLNWFLGKWPPTSIVRLHPTSECERINFTIWA